MGVVLFKDGDQIVGNEGYNEECVAFLEDLLERSKQGEIIGVCAAVQYADKSAGDGQAGFFWKTGMIGCLTRIIHSLV